MASSASIEEAALQLLKKARAEDHELITLYRGIDLEHAEANRIADAVRKEFPAQEIEVQDGGQPHYLLILSVE